MPISSVISAAVSALLLACLLSGCTEKTAEETRFNQDLAQQNAALQQQVTQLKFRLDSLQNPSDELANTSNNSLLTETDLNYLKKRGLQDPVNQIKISLLQNSQLIPAEGTLGGTMQFYEERIYVLNRKWVLAYFEDGHMAGQLLLAYTVGNNGKLSWQVIASMM